MTAFATAKSAPKEVVTWCHEAAVDAFLVALGKIGLVLPCSGSWCWVTAVVQVSQDWTGGEVAAAGLWGFVSLSAQLFGGFPCFAFSLKNILEIRLH